jgi:hypothetical protein
MVSMIIEQKFSYAPFFMFSAFWQAPIENGARSQEIFFHPSIGGIAESSMNQAGSGSERNFR